jgi:hypothetical protein
MKQNILRILIFMVSCLVCCSCYAGAGEEIKKPPGYEQADPPKRAGEFVNKDVSAFLGERLRVIRDADKAEAYRIDWSQKSVQMIQRYPVADRRDLTAEQINSLKRLIFSPASYEFQWAKRTRIRPSYMLRFIRGGDVADIAADLNSRQWAFYYRGHIAEEDISESAMPVLSGILDSLFKN